MPESSPAPAAEQVVQRLSLRLSDDLMRGEGMNDFLHRFSQTIGSALDSPRVVLYDYDEVTDTFDLLYFLGYPPGSRSDLHKRLHTLNVRRGLTHRDPYVHEASDLELLVPLYFQETLEAVLLLESGGRPLVLDDSTRRACRLISRFLGLFMSSSRLPVNQRQDLPDLVDLERAREVQMSYLPAEHPVTDRYEIYGYNQSSAVVGGDYFDYFSHKQSSIQCIVADGCGHGMAAALIMSTFRGLLHSEVRQFDELPTLFTRLNERLYGGSGLLKYLTGVFLDYQEVEHELHYFNAGHFDPLIVHADGTTAALSGGGPPLGMFRESTYQMMSSHVAPGDLLVLFTDGLVEMSNPKDEFFGEDGIKDVVCSGRDLPLRDLAAEMLTSAATFSEGQQPDDDLTLFLMRFR